jgi:hypothetical protein
MEKTLRTPRLKLTLFENLEEEGKDMEWAHVLRTDEGAMSWKLVLILLGFLEFGHLGSSPENLVEGPLFWRIE